LLGNTRCEATSRTPPRPRVIHLQVDFSPDEDGFSGTEIRFHIAVENYGF
jgi:hypothetical protein